MRWTFMLYKRQLLLFIARLWSVMCYLFRKQTQAVCFTCYYKPIIFKVVKYQSVRYDIVPLSPLSKYRLCTLRRKVMVLDLDETLIHSVHDGILRPTVRPGTPPDFVLKVDIDHHPVRFSVHKRPHVDFFLNVVSCALDLSSVIVVVIRR
ncbi:hypothetical protein EG68_12173 [Paragonimus skrjabini miyazakii]|uniref:FCP1 homology domain-containing protein n=1 Tax=Paragonimus skrjabini miyazakii TaxID=59628 RepID=A0A8S9YB86_9TREM|nr:hypothetical protein EG68_12173 [Paragonimus skrjabini miyazakii]